MTSMLLRVLLLATMAVAVVLALPEDSSRDTLRQDAVVPETHWADPAPNTVQLKEGMVEEGIHMVALTPTKQRVQTKRDVEELGLLETSAVPPAPNDAKNLHEVALEDRSNMQYFGQIAVGTPKDGSQPEQFRVVFDSGSFVCWVPDNICKSAACKTHSRFKLHDSSTGSILDVQGGQVPLAYIKYGTGSMQGVHAAETVRVGSLVVPNTGILAATSEKGEVFEQSPFDGVIGFSRHDDTTVLPSDKSKKVHFNFMVSAKEEGRIKSNIASFFLSFKSGSSGGAAILGGVDERLIKPGAKLQYHPVVQKSNGNWALRITKLYLKSDPSTNFCDPKVAKKGCLGVVDTGTSLVVGAPPIFGGENGLLSKIKMASDCSNADKMDEIQMVFEGSDEVYKLEGRDYTIMLVAGDTKQCEPALKEADSRIPETFPGQPEMPLVILGDVFMRRYYTAFDNDDPNAPKIGLAEANDAVQIQSQPDTSAAGHLRR